MFINQIQQLVRQINDIISQLTDDEYSRPLNVFNGSSIGQHTRHVIEFFAELEQGYQNGLINYDNRKRNKKLETDKQFALDLLNEFTSACDKEDKHLQLSVDLQHSPTMGMIATTYYRELAFAVEHTVHHMAFLRIGIEQVKNIAVPTDFGISASTQRYRSSCAQ
ncbi:MAG: hypothetical protein V4717_13910 [Bacteroidota bacterium]